jgi:hypothetical protein
MHPALFPLDSRPTTTLPFGISTQQRELSTPTAPLSFRNMKQWGSKPTTTPPLCFNVTEGFSTSTSTTTTSHARRGPPSLETSNGEVSAPTSNWLSVKTRDGGCLRPPPTRLLSKQASSTTTTSNLDTISPIYTYFTVFSFVSSYQY